MNKTDEQFKYPLLIADRLEILSKSGSYVHGAKAYCDGIRKNIDVLCGTMEKPEWTSLGSLEFLETQVKRGEAILTKAARPLTK